MALIKKVLANVLQSLTAGEMAIARDNIDAQQKLVIGDGLKLTGNNLKADVVKIQPWKYFNHYVPSDNWTSKVHAGTCDLDSADIASGIIKIPFDNVQWRAVPRYICNQVLWRRNPFRSLRQHRPGQSSMGSEAVAQAVRAVIQVHIPVQAVDGGHRVMTDLLTPSA